MAYFVRVFCTAGEPPALDPILAYARDRGSEISLDRNVEDASDDTSWSSVGLAYKPGKLPILVEVNRRDGDDTLVQEEVEEFIELLEASGSADRNRIESHLRATTFVVAAQLPTGDIDDDGYKALGSTLSYFVDHHEGMIQADGEGFYDGDEVIVPLT